mmetsp:Transcript_62000/g.135582  ORF Transcript_62000/g.135582 Transcript_62000/m.135582 type:complete len:468 (+) Transcript_62000:112-1515(+)|eukprot:CAMPEP_0206433330 /NCGR_PEP_ID=MMETSP0324_2-20121206/8468_1 /ASSEMBLY_ACC=CAM_ASM_000836 /TAXON_ID=2866 /ORGANISM="Crypthecodinium cohnii, Strain Seligo" /LENGTH=467 /DNA_ID=CAMNT_0053899573 /DNA_START=45 /DNA_END=1448 /DNA_ORIENTATION=+
MSLRTALALWGSFAILGCLAIQPQDDASDTCDAEAGEGCPPKRHENLMLQVGKHQKGLMAKEEEEASQKATPQLPWCCFSWAKGDDPCTPTGCYAGAMALSDHWCGNEINCSKCSATAKWCPAASTEGAASVEESTTTTSTKAKESTTTKKEQDMEETSSSTTASPATKATTATSTKSTTATSTTTKSTTTTSTSTTASSTTTTTSSSSKKQHAVTSKWISGTYTTGYWDCCKPSCSWSGKGNVKKPIRSCSSKTGEKLFDADTKSVCDGGTAASCPDNQPFVVKPSLSMGFAAAAVSGAHGLTGDANCGQCYELYFSDKQHITANGDIWGGAHPDLQGKSMIIQVTNIGYDVTGDHSFDIQIPGAGQGIFTNGCANQFSTFSVEAFDCANNYGGCQDSTGCSKLPESLQAGCHWRYEWLKWNTGAKTNNPYVDFRRVKCPTQLTDISWSIPLDDDEYPEINIDEYP